MTQLGPLIYNPAPLHRVRVPRGPTGGNQQINLGKFNELHKKNIYRPSQSKQKDKTEVWNKDHTFEC